MNLNKILVISALAVLPAILGACATPPTPTPVPTATRIPPSPTLVPTVAALPSATATRAPSPTPTTAARSEGCVACHTNKASLEKLAVNVEEEGPAG